MKGQRQAVALCVALCSAVVALIAAATPAAASDQPCAPAGGGTLGSAVCMVVTQNPGVYGEIVTALPDGVHSVTVAAFQCSGTGTNCTVIAQVSDVGHVWLGFATKIVPYSPGHTYKAVGSWTDSTGRRYVSVYTPLGCCPTH